MLCNYRTLLNGGLLAMFLSRIVATWNIIESEQRVSTLTCRVQHFIVYKKIKLIDLVYIWKL